MDTFNASHKSLHYPRTRTELWSFTVRSLHYYTLTILCPVMVLSILASSALHILTVLSAEELAIQFPSTENFTEETALVCPEIQRCLVCPEIQRCLVCPEIQRCLVCPERQRCLVCPEIQRCLVSPEIHGDV